jgi:hypothetical protein
MMAAATGILTRLAVDGPDEGKFVTREVSCRPVSRSSDPAWPTPDPDPPGAERVVVEGECEGHWFAHRHRATGEVRLVAVAHHSAETLAVVRKMRDDADAAAKKSQADAAAHDLLVERLRVSALSPDELQRMLAAMAAKVGQLPDLK